MRPIPKRSFWFAFACLAIAPALARLPGAGHHGIDWLYRYLPIALVASITAWPLGVLLSRRR